MEPEAAGRSGSSDGGNRLGVDSLWVDPVVGRGEDAVGPVLDVALVVTSSADGSGFYGGRGGGERADSANRGLEARVKIGLDKVRTVFSIPFVESLTRHVLAGPLVLHLLGEDGATPGLRDAESTSPLRPPLSPSPPQTETRFVDEAQGAAAAPQEMSSRVAASSDERDAARCDSLSGRSAKDGAAGWKDVVDAPRGDLREGDCWERIVFIKVHML